jgi:hypothetical protein
MEIRMALEQAQGEHDGHQAHDSDTRGKTAPVHREPTAMRFAGDTRCE